MDNVIARVVVSLLVILSIAGVGTAARQMYMNQKIQTFSTAINLFVSAAKQYFANSASFKALDTMPVTAFPQLSPLWANQSHTASVDTMQNPGEFMDLWGDAMSISSGAAAKGVPSFIAAGSGKDAGHIVVSLAAGGISSNECVALVNTLTSAEIVYVNNTNISAQGNVTGGGIDQNTLNNACGVTMSTGFGSSGSSGGPSMAFVFGH